MPALFALARVARILARRGQRWGPGGSVGFEVTLFLEMAPGDVSTHLVAMSFSDVRAVSIEDRGLRYATVLAARASEEGLR